MHCLTVLEVMVPNGLHQEKSGCQLCTCDVQKVLVEKMKDEMHELLFEARLVVLCLKDTGASLT